MSAARILFVCTANRCRSVMAEALARRRFADLSIEVASGGLLPGGLPVPPHGIAVAHELGIDVSGHRSRRLDLTGLRGWDVILTMTRAQAREVIAADPGLWPRVFTLPSFARWLDAHPPARRMSLAGWIDVVAEDRPRSEILGASRDDDVEDPVDGPPRAWRRMNERLGGDLERIASRLGGPAVTG